MESVPIAKCNKKSYRKFKSSNEVLFCRRSPAGHALVRLDDIIIRLMAKCIQVFGESLAYFFEKFLNTFKYSD